MEKDRINPVWAEFKQELGTCVKAIGYIVLGMMIGVVIVYCIWEALT